MDVRGSDGRREDVARSLDPPVRKVAVQKCTCLLRTTGTRYSEGNEA